MNPLIPKQRSGRHTDRSGEDKSVPQDAFDGDDAEFFEGLGDGFFVVDVGKWDSL